jgi:hypothetical protein
MVIPRSDLGPIEYLWDVVDDEIREVWSNNLRDSLR